MEKKLTFSMKEVGFIGDLTYDALNIAGDGKNGHLPSELLVSSIVVCSSGVLRSILNKKRIEFDDLSVHASYIKSDGEVSKVEKITIHYVIHGKNLVPDTISRSVEIARKNCPMIQSVKGSIEINETFDLVEISR